MSVCTPKDRVRAAFRRTLADRVPSYPILGVYTTQLTGDSTRDYLTQARPLARGQFAALEAYEPDILVLVRDLVTEAEALGSRVALLEGHVSYVAEYALADEPQKLARLSPPDVANDGRFPSYWEACEIVAGQVRDVPVGTLLTGPWTIAANLRGAENLIKDALKRPDYVRELLELTTQVAVATAEAAHRAGVGVSYSEAAASCSLISPRMYREFVTPVHRKLFGQLAQKKISATLHICGYIDPVMEDIVDSGIAALSIDRDSNLETLVDLNDRRVVVIGNVSVSAFETGSKEDVEAEVRRCVDTAASPSAFILSSACEIPPTAKPENVAHFASFAKEYGRYANLGIASGR